MGMPFGNAGDDETCFFFRSGFAVHEGEHVVHVTHCEDLSVANRHGLCKTAVSVGSIDRTADDSICVHSGCLLWYDARTAIPMSHTATTTKIRREETT